MCYVLAFFFLRFYRIVFSPFKVSENLIAIDVPIMKLLFVGVVLVSNMLSLLFNQRPSSRQMILCVGE
jgi:hypothetical protein